MKRIISLALLLPLTTHATCYMVFNKNGDLVYQATTAPFDLSSPPDSPDYSAAKAKGYRVQISPDCVIKRRATNIEIANDLAHQNNLDIAAELRRQVHEDYERKRRANFIKDTDEELLRRGEIAVKQLRQMNDLDNQ